MRASSQRRRRSRRLRAGTCRGRAVAESRSCRSVPPPRRTCPRSPRSTTTTPSRRSRPSTTSRPGPDALAAQGRRRPGHRRAPAGRGRRRRRGPRVRRVGGLPRRPAYDHTREVSVYLGLDARQQGYGRKLYDELLGLLRADGIHVALAVIALPNPTPARRCTARAASPRPACVRRGGLEVRRLGRHRRAWQLRAAARRRPALHDDPAERAAGDQGRRDRPRLPALGAPPRGRRDADAHRRRPASR